MREFVLTNIMDNIWIPRCDYLHEIEKELNISKRYKKILRSRKNNNNTINSDNHVTGIDRKINTLHRFHDLDGIRNNIYFGGNILDYYNVHVR